jgi:hypothetical protein
MIESLACSYPRRPVCDWLELASSTYYYQPTGADDAALLVRIEDVLADYPTYGYRRGHGGERFVAGDRAWGTHNR